MTSMGEAAMDVLRAAGAGGATAAEVAATLRHLGHGATTPEVAARLAKYARRGACRVVGLERYAAS